jgi:hypothetical protein
VGADDERPFRAWLGSLIGSTLYLAGRRVARAGDQLIVSISGLTAGTLLLPFVPMTFAAVQLVILLVIAVASRTRRQTWLIPVAIGVVLGSTTSRRSTIR